MYKVYSLFDSCNTFVTTFFKLGYARTYSVLRAWVYCVESGTFYKLKIAIFRKIKIIDIFQYLSKIYPRLFLGIFSTIL